MNWPFKAGRVRGEEKQAEKQLEQRLESGVSPVGVPLGPRKPSTPGGDSGATRSAMMGSQGPGGRGRRLGWGGCSQQWFHWAMALPYPRTTSLIFNLADER